MKVLIVDDKQGSAINILSNFIAKHNRQHKIDILSLHPKRPDADTIEFLKQHWQDYDLIHWQYWKSWRKAIELIPEINKTSILSHYNPYDVMKENWWDNHKEVVFCTEKQRNQVGRGTIIRLGVDESLWKWNPKYESPKSIGVCAARIEGKKGIREVAEVSKEMGIPLILMGRISDANYWKEIQDTGAEIQFHENVPFEDMLSIYEKMGVYVCNSVSNFETGPMPVFEAALCGVPIVSRRVGSIDELFDENGIVFFNKKEEMRGAIEQAFERADELRMNGWNTAKGFNSVKYAWEYNKMYHKTAYGDYPLVSVIIPYVEERVELLQEIKKSIDNQTYKNVEIIAIEDKDDGYNLARSRNLGIIQSRGEYLLFLDDRFALENDDCITNMLKQHNKRVNVFIWGDKGAGKRQFVENFSFTKRQDLIDAGMFNERVNVYGGMSQEIRTRLNRQGWEFKFCENAKAKTIKKSSSKNQRKDEILKAKILLYKLGL